MANCRKLTALDFICFLQNPSKIFMVTPHFTGGKKADTQKDRLIWATSNRTGMQTYLHLPPQSTADSSVLLTLVGDEHPRLSLQVMPYPRFPEILISLVWMEPGIFSLGFEYPARVQEPQCWMNHSSQPNSTHFCPTTGKHRGSARGRKSDMV